MAWNDNNNQTPPELDEVIKDFKNKFNSLLLVESLQGAHQVTLVQVKLQREVLSTS